MVDLLQRHKATSDKEKTIRLGDEEYLVEILPVKLAEKNTGTIIYLKDNRLNNQAAREKNEFVSNISHDLRSPLKLMGGYTRLIKHIGNLSSQQNILVDRLESGIEDMRRLVSRVLDLERLDNDAGLMYTTFDFKEMVDETIDMLEVQAQQKKITVHTDFGSVKTPYISADRILLQQAIYNLIENAIKFSPRGETVLIRAEKDASWMHLSIKDNGKGIAPLDQTRIFNRFFHMDDEQNFENRGQGLGLSIVKSIAEKHGGSISVESRLGSGSTFYMDVPLHRLDGLKNLTKASE
jgi:signal transduction histidine kinase